jgi:hypothetical protein
VKRRQRVVPVIKPLKNTTVEFVQTIGNLYYQEGDTHTIIEKKIIYFLDRVRHKYYLDTGKLDNVFAEKLQSKSGKERQLIDDILAFIQMFQRAKQGTSADLMKLNDLIDRFWENNK